MHSDGFTSSFLLHFLSSLSPRESSSFCPSSGSHELAAPYLVYPILISSSHFSPHASASTSKKCPPWPHTANVPAGYRRGQCLVSHHLSTLPSPPNLSAVRPTPHTWFIHAYIQHSNIHKDHVVCTKQPPNNTMALNIFGLLVIG